MTRLRVDDANNSAPPRRSEFRLILHGVGVPAETEDVPLVVELGDGGPGDDGQRVTRLPTSLVGDGTVELVTARGVDSGRTPAFRCPA